MKANAKNTATDQSLVDFLTAELDEIYYDGYTEDILATDPEKFNWELAELKGQFSKN
jgi:hypothetical protein